MQIRQISSERILGKHCFLCVFYFSFKRIFYNIENLTEIILVNTKNANIEDFKAFLWMEGRPLTILHLICIPYIYYFPSAVNPTYISKAKSISRHMKNMWIIKQTMANRSR